MDIARPTGKLNEIAIANERNQIPNKCQCKPTFRVVTRSDVNKVIDVIMITPNRKLK
jgi:hypothetical protein